LMKSVAILGPGLLGGSIALALRDDAETNVRLWARRSEALEEARALGVADLVTGSVEEAVEGVDIVVLCVPVGAMEDLVRRALPKLSSSTLVTDVGSVKRPVCDRLAPLLSERALFVGSHPMAGSEKAGISAARGDLFLNAVCILTPEPGRTRPAAYELAEAFWTRLGCRVRSLLPHTHDEVCALISHLPHLTAAALVQNVTAACPEAFGFCGPGFRDSTRIASGLPSMWTEILSSNRVAVAGSLRRLIALLEPLAAQLERGGTEAEAVIHGFLASAKVRRDGLSQSTIL
jgi:prephenate dehydrogenase